MIFLRSKGTNKVSKDNRENAKNTLTPKETMNFFHSILELKFAYWYQSKLAPNMIAGKSESNTPKYINECKKIFSQDVKLAVSRSIMTSLLKTYFLNIKSIDIYIDQYFTVKYNNKEDSLDKYSFNSNQMIPKGGIVNAV